MDAAGTTIDVYTTRQSAVMEAGNGLSREEAASCAQPGDHPCGLGRHGEAGQFRWRRNGRDWTESRSLELRTRTITLGIWKLAAVRLPAASASASVTLHHDPPCRAGACVAPAE